MAPDGRAKTALGGELTADFAAALAWWREAGIDCGFDDAPRDWLARLPEAAPAATAPAPSPPRLGTTPPRLATPPAPRFGGDLASWPHDLAGFAEWWLSQPALGVGEDRHRVAPRGPAGAALMVVVPQPEADDRERLLSGPQGRLLAAICGALGLADEQVYVASAVPSHVGLIDWAELAGQDIAAVVAHHVALAGPRRALLLGGDGASALLGHDPARSAAPPPHFHHDPWQIQVACAASLESLLGRPTRKAGVWRTLLEWGP